MQKLFKTEKTGGTYLGNIFAGGVETVIEERLGDDNHILSTPWENQTVMFLSNFCSSGEQAVCLNIL